MLVGGLGGVTWSHETNAAEEKVRELKHEQQLKVQNNLRPTKKSEKSSDDDAGCCCLCCCRGNKTNVTYVRAERFGEEEGVFTGSGG